MKKLFLLFLLILKNHPSEAQMNLVNNPSFEDTLNCDSIHFIHASYPWFMPTNCTPDYYYGLNPTCGNSALQNPSGFQMPYEGIAYVGIFLTDGANTRDYICSALLNTLISGKQYYLEFFVSRANLFALATDDIGAYISQQIPINSGCSFLPYQPQVENPQGNILTDSLNWTKISGIFTAQGGENYLTIGNFKDSTNTTIIDADSGNGEYNNAYYYIDKVSLIPLDSLQGINDVNNFGKSINVFPTFFTKGATFQVNSNISQDCNFELFSIDGRKVLSGIIQHGNNYLKSENLISGIYILCVYGETKVFSKKILVY
jgi:hypothetical protein